MEIGELYSFVLIIVFVGMLAGVGVLLLNKMETSTALTDPTREAVSNAVAAVADIPEDWMSLIVTIAVLAIILGLVISSFAMRRR